MKKVFFGLAFAIAASFAATVRADGYEDWFTPSGGFSKQPTFDVYVEIGSFGTDLPFSMTDNLDAIYAKVDFLAESVPTTAKNAFELAKNALVSAIYAQCQAKLNECKINNIASAIEGMVVANYGQYQDKSGNKISKSKANVARDQLLKSKNSIVAGNGATQGDENNPIVIEVQETPFSDKHFEQYENGGTSKTVLYGTKNLQKDGSGYAGASDYFWNVDSAFFPMVAGSPASEYLEWLKFGGIGEEFECSTSSDELGKLRLKDFRGWTGDGKSLDWLLSDETSDGSIERTKYQVLARRRDGTKSVLTYLPINNYIQGGGGGIPADEASIETHIDGDTTNLCVYGFNDAVESAAAGDEYGYIPYTDGSETLQWAGMSEFFADSVFKKSEKTGKILLNGTSEEGKTTVLAISGDGEEEQTLTTFSGDGVSIDFGIDQQGQPQAPLAQLHNFNVAPSPYGGYSTLTFADALTNASATISGMSIPVRYPNGNRIEIGYIPMGKVTGIPSASVDDLTIENSKDEGAGDDDPDKLRIKGAKTATKGQLLKMGDEGQVEWGDFPIEVDLPEGLEKDEYPLYITEADPENDEPAKIGINGWETTDSPEGLYGAGNGKPVTYRFADIKSLEADADERTVELKGYADAGNYSMAFKDSENGLGWVAPPSSGSALLTMNNGAEPTATVLGNSVETETLNNKVTLNIKGFTNGGGCDTTMSDMMTSDSQSLNRSRHQVLTRYTGGANPAVHWVDMGDKIGGGADVDDASITTNTAHGAVTSGLASIYGFANAADGQVPTAAGEGSTKHIEWKKPTLKTGNYDYNETEHTVGGGFYVIGRTYQYCAGGTSVTGQGWMYLKVPMFWGSSSATCSMIFSTSQPPESDGQWTYVRLYYFNSNKEVVADYRNIPHIQAWE